MWAQMSDEELLTRSDLIVMGEWVGQSEPLTLGGTVRVELKTDILNERSQRAIERIGATREGVFRKHLQRRDGTWRDSVYFSVIDDEWMRVKAHLEGLLAI